jgi:L-alanine-DL-glutamate epimerase-like enolase superfamily enzyme
MKIKDVQALPFAVPVSGQGRHCSNAGRLARQVVVKIVTDDGLTGIGEAYFPRDAPFSVCNLIEHGLKPYLVGEDPTLIERLLERIYRKTYTFARRGLGLFAISGVEIALWDLVGKMRGLPVAALQGGLLTPKIRAYASLLRYERPEEVVEVVHEYLERGFTALKLHQTDVESVRAAREAAGDKVDLMLDVNCAWNPIEARRKIREFDDYNLLWIEEPVWPPEDYRGLAEVAAAVEVPIAAGENESTRFGFRELILQRSVDIVQPSLCKVGGLLETKKICHLASALNLPVAPHVFYLGAGMAAAVHLVASTPGCLFVEYPAVELEAEFLIGTPRPQDGFLEISNRPGLGVELNEEVIKHYPYVSP